jgi:hypothetical protein
VRVKEMTVTMTTVVRDMFRRGMRIMMMGMRITIMRMEIMKIV